MLRFLSAFALLAMSASPLSHAAERQGSAPEADFVSLFDGQTMTGWKPHLTVPKAHVGGKWYVKDGLLYGDQDENEGGGFLITEGEYDDFILRFDLFQDYPTDTGIFVRMGEDGKSHQITLDNRPGGQIGSVYLPWTQARVLDNPEGYKAFKQGKWNTVEIRVEGEPSHIQFWLNGVKVTDLQHTPETTKGVPVKGHIGLQVHPKTPGIVHWKAGNTIRYKNIRILPLAKN
ncbi:3-keto-disaccharide hydrolase [Planctomicrobium piriforme]|uniref:3-keto-alpha-glucoside-1,2-lyase/3-keto-2-hydroxy-glucal hydratase domain-containing protein n=1 Tax=Planctomicrobium piriforme TaxID=1576369 RepID=A0A1I3H1J9_9PLAN|nr:DUF1080 domain-containing protein [Planctomicrobium piriforme]SFI29561.1 protein of unknown function [Planctomicrobium piriforme]